MEKNRIEEQGKKEFQAIEKIKEFLLTTHKDLDNFPKRDVELKDEIKKLIFEILELAEKTNIYSNEQKYLKIKEENLVEIRAKIAILDTMFLYVYQENIITGKRKMASILKRLGNINRLVMGWHKMIIRLLDEEEKRLADVTQTIVDIGADIKGIKSNIEKIEANIGEKQKIQQSAEAKDNNEKIEKNIEENTSGEEVLPEENSEDEDDQELSLFNKTEYTLEEVIQLVKMVNSYDMEFEKRNEVFKKITSRCKKIKSKIKQNKMEEIITKEIDEELQNKLNNFIYFVYKVKENYIIKIIMDITTLK